MCVGVCREVDGGDWMEEVGERGRDEEGWMKRDGGGGLNGATWTERHGWSHVDGGGTLMEGPGWREVEGRWMEGPG